MNKIYPHLINIFSVVLLFIFTFIVVTENTRFINNNYKASIISTLEKEVNLDINIEEIDIEWNGLVPKIIFHKISLVDKETKKIIIAGDKLVATLNLYESVFQNKIVPKAFDLVNTDVNLRYDNGKLLFKDKDIFDLKDTFIAGNDSKTDFSKLTFRISNSSILLRNLPFFKQYQFKNINLVLISKNNNLRIFTTFNHTNTAEIVHIAADLNLSKDKKPSGLIYSKGINLSAAQLPFETKSLETSAKSLNYTIWSSLTNGKISALDGKFSANKININHKIAKDKLTLTNIDSHISYSMNNQEKNLFFYNLDITTPYHKYINNKFFLKLKENNGTDLVINNIQVNDFKSIINFFPNMLSKKITKVFKYIESGEINTANFIDLHKTKKTKFLFSFKDIKVIQKDGKFVVNNLSGNSAGNFERGFLKVKSPDLGVTHPKLSDQQQPFDVKALINYQFKKNNLYLNTKDLFLNNLHRLNINASFNRGKLDFRATSSGEVESLKKTLKKYKIKNINNNDLVLSGKYYIDVRGKNYLKKKNLYGVFEISKIGIYDKNSKLSLTNLNTRVNFNGSHLISEKTKFYFQKNKFDLIINTDILEGTTKYFIQANGKVGAQLIKNFLKIKDQDMIRGESFSKIRIYFTPKHLFNKINFNLISDLKGVSIDIIGPLRKSIDERKLLNVTYSYNKTGNNKIRVFFEKYKMLVALKKNVWILNVDSPYLKGNINWPINNSEENHVVAKLQYLNMNKFNYFSTPNELPYLDLASKQVKVGNLHLDNVEVLTVPTKNGLTFERFIFNNVHLSMSGTGEWNYNNKKVETFFDAKFESDNLGRALKSLGYNGLINKGKIKSQLVGTWDGSPDKFRFSNFDGNLIINSNNGEVLQVTKETKAIGQLLGLFSISALPKRLSLDFSDFFSSGLKYDDMVGELSFKAGKADTKKLILKGTFGEMRLSGETDLITETYDQTLLFIPDLSSTSLITGAVVGGPVGAVAAIFYDKFLKEIGEKALGIDTKKLAAIEYSVTGPWENPEVKVTESFKPILN